MSVLNCADGVAKKIKATFEALLPLARIFVPVHY